MEKCIFCEIVAKRIPSAIIYEDDDFMAFLDINPLNAGHTLIVTKEHARWVYDVDNFGDFWEVAKSVALAAVEALKADTVHFITLGHEVPHAHIHCIPRFENDGHGNQPLFANRKQIPNEEMAQIAEKLKAAIANNPPKKAVVAAKKPKKTFRKVAEDDVEKLIQLYNSGKSIKEIEEITGFSRGTIKRHLADAGLLKREKSKAAEQKDEWAEYVRRETES